MGMAIFGWAVLFLITLYAWFNSYKMVAVSLGFTGRISGEVYFFIAISAVLTFLCWWLFPLDVAIQASIK